MRFLHTSDLTASYQAELALSMEVVHHLVEDSVFDAHMRQLFDAAARAWPNPHVRHRQFTTWVRTHRTDFELVEMIPNRYPYSKSDAENTSFADFYIFERVQN